MIGSDLFIIGSPVSCSDGECGVLKGIIFGDVSHDLLQITVAAKSDNAARSVPADKIASADTSVQLNLSMSDFEALEYCEETVSVHAPMLPNPIRSAGMVTGIGAAIDHVNAERVTDPVTVVRDFVPDHAAEICDGISAHATNGTIGSAVGAMFGSDDRVLTHVIIETGHLWSKSNATIAVEEVTSFDDGIYLKLSKKEIVKLGQK